MGSGVEVCTQGERESGVTSSVLEFGLGRAHEDPVHEATRRSLRARKKLVAASEQVGAK